eukprot:15135912-Ditylum_brightwellii.AAC.1
MHGQSHWKQILHIMTKSGVKFMLTNFLLIDEADPNEVQKKCSPKESTTTKDMYITLGKSFARPIKIAMQTITNNNETD